MGLFQLSLRENVLEVKPPAVDQMTCQAGESLSPEVFL